MRFVEDFENKARGTQSESSEQGADGALAIHASPQNSENKADRDRRADIGLHALQINPQLRAEQVDERNPQNAEDNHDAGGDTSESDQLFLGGVGAELLVEVQGNNGGSGIENGTHRTHQRGQKRGNHQADKTGGQKAYDHFGVGDVAVGDVAVHHVKKAWIQGESDQTGKDQEKYRKHF